jgi:predicted HAD superfamily hydrolase
MWFVTGCWVEETKGGSLSTSIFSDKAIPVSRLLFRCIALQHSPSCAMNCGRWIESSKMPRSCALKPSGSLWQVGKKGLKAQRTPSNLGALTLTVMKAA